MESKTLIALYDFENRVRIFPDVDGRFKFCVLLFGGAQVTRPRPISSSSLTRWRT